MLPGSCSILMPPSNFPACVGGGSLGRLVRRSLKSYCASLTALPGVSGVLRQSACVTTFPASRIPATVASKIALILISSLIRQVRRSTGVRFLVALEPVRDLLVRAKDLFVAAIALKYFVRRCHRGSSLRPSAHRRDAGEGGELVKEAKGLK